MTPPIDWERLLSAALIGTERAPALHDGDPTPAHTLLIEASRTGLYRRAGFVPPQRAALPAQDPLPPETLPPCSLRTMMILTGLFNEPLNNKLMIFEVLTHVARKGKRIPHLHLQRLFDYASTQRRDGRWVGLTAAVMGERGRWLAHQHTKWEFLAQAAPVIPEPLPPLNDEQIRYLTVKILGASSVPEVDGDLQRFEAAWTMELAHLLIDHLILNSKKIGGYGGGLKEVVFLFPPDGLGELLTKLQDYHYHLAPPYARFVEVVHMRKTILGELAHE